MGILHFKFLSFFRAEEWAIGHLMMHTTTSLHQAKEPLNNEFRTKWPEDQSAYFKKRDTQWGYARKGGPLRAK
jgi:hypothetical protein